jgi:hypothetical protein
VSVSRPTVCGVVKPQPVKVTDEKSPVIVP